MTREVERRDAALTGRSKGSEAALWLALLALLGAAFVAPFGLAGLGGRGFGGLSELQSQLASALGRAWSSGQATSPEVAEAVNFWQRFHVIKAVLAGAALAVLGWLALPGSSWIARRWMTRVVRAVAVAGSFVLALLLFVANVQGALAPYASAMSLVIPASGHSGLAAQVQQLKLVLHTSSPGPVAPEVLAQFVRYHQVMAVLAVLATIALLALTVRSFRQAGQAPVNAQRRSAAVLYRMIRVLPAAGLGALAVFFAITGVANVSTAARPLSPLISFLGGGN